MPTPIAFPHHVVGKIVLLKIKNGMIRFYNNHDFLVDNHLFYEQLKQDRQQPSRKYGKQKGKATRGLVTGSFRRWSIAPLPCRI